jgi:proteasome lid subunit RPN8/RPN11
VLELRRDAYDEIVRQAERGADDEICGVLAGEYGDGESRVTDIYAAENVADEPRIRYAIDPEALLDLIDRIEARGMDVVGFYHSHPSGPPVPSETDTERATWTDYSYVVCALDGYPFVGSWRWRGDEFEPETVAVV